MFTRYMIINKTTGKSHGWCLTRAFALRNAGVNEKVVKQEHKK